MSALQTQVWLPCGDAPGVGPLFRAARGLVQCHAPPLRAYAAAAAAAVEGGAFSLPALAAGGGGCVQVVQDLSILPPWAHPRSRLPPAAAALAGGALFVPVFDAARGGAPLLAVVEALLARRPADPVLLPNLASFLGARLAAAGLSLCSPLPQPVRRSTLAGRRARPPRGAAGGSESASDGEGEGAGDRAGGAPAGAAGGAAHMHSTLQQPGAAHHGAQPRSPRRAPAAAAAEAAAAAAAAAAATAAAAASALETPSNSGDSAHTGGDLASCGQFRPPPGAVRALAGAGAARGRGRSADEGWSSAPTGKRACTSAAAPAAGAAAAACAGLRRTVSVSRSLRDLAVTVARA